MHTARKRAFIATKIFDDGKVTISRATMPLIAALLLALYSGKRPGRRAMELIQFYLLGYATPEEVSRQLGLNQKNS